MIYVIYGAFFDIQRIDGHEILQEISSPSGKNTITVYLKNGGATTDYAVLCSVKDNQSDKERNVYWQYHCNDANVQWMMIQQLLMGLNWMFGRNPMIIEMIDI